MRLSDAKRTPTDPLHPHALFLSQLPCPNLPSSDEGLETEFGKQLWRGYEQMIQEGAVDRWAIGHAISRAHYAKNVLKLIPIMDLANHEGPKNSNSQYVVTIDDTRRGIPPKVDMKFFVARTNGIQQGDEAVYMYSPFKKDCARDRDRWRIYSGFVPSH
jgi:hypothetical protein